MHIEEIILTYFEIRKKYADLNKFFYTYFRIGIRICKLKIKSKISIFVISKIKKMLEINQAKNLILLIQSLTRPFNGVYLLSSLFTRPLRGS